jgi:hypothetical protein
MQTVPIHTRSLPQTPHHTPFAAFLLSRVAARCNGVPASSAASAASMVLAWRCLCEHNWRNYLRTNCPSNPPPHTLKPTCVRIFKAAAEMHHACLLLLLPLVAALLVTATAAPTPTPLHLALATAALEASGEGSATGASPAARAGEARLLRASTAELNAVRAGFNVDDDLLPVALPDTGSVVSALLGRVAGVGGGGACPGECG